MKYKVRGIILLLILFPLAILANNYIKKINPVRIEQHKQKIKSTCNESDEFCTNLPIVKINTNNETFKMDETMIKADFELYYKKDETNKLSDLPSLTSEINIRYRGNSSFDFDKHQYLVKFIDGEKDKKVSLLGMNEENNWILNGPFLDKTLIRNYLIYNISGKITDSVPEVRFCELYLNGEYQGVYLLIESVSRTLTDITKYKPNWSNGMSSYILRMDRTDTNNIMIDNYSKYINKVVPGNSINIVYPSESDITTDIKEYITNDLSKFEKALYSFDYEEYEKYIDVDSFVDYMLINEFFKNSDAGTHSTYLYKDVRGKIHMGPVWDFNNSMNNYVEEIYSAENFMFQDKVWYEMLLKDEKFVNKVIERYRYLRTNVLSNDYLQQYIDDTVNFLGNAIDRNFDVWGYTFTKDYLPNMLKPSDRNYTSYDEALTQIKKFIEDRGEWLDENIETLKQYSHPSANKMYNGS